MKKFYNANPVRVEAMPMKLGDYNKMQGSTGSDLQTEGYYLKYDDGTKDWKDKETFELFYTPRKTYDIGDAMSIIKNGWFATREGWHGKGMFIFHVNKTKIDSAISAKYEETIGLYDGSKYILGWSPSVSDALATDWKRADISMVPSALLSES